MLARGGGLGTLMAMAASEVAAPDGEGSLAPLFPREPSLRPTPWEAVTMPRLRNLVVALLIAAVAAAGAALVVLHRKASYVSSATLILEQPSVISSSGDAGVVVKLNELRPKYIALVHTDEILVPVARNLGVTRARIAGTAGAFAARESLILGTTGRSSNRAFAQQVAQAVAQELVTYVTQEQTAAGIPPNLRLRMRIVQAALGAGKVAPTKSHAASSAAVAGVAALVAVYVLLQLVTVGRRPV